MTIVSASKNLTFSVDQEFLEVMNYILGFTIVAQVFVDRMSGSSLNFTSMSGVSSRGGNFYFAKSSPLSALCFGKSLDFFLRSRLLVSELVARESKDLQPLSSKTFFFVHTNQFFV